MSEVVRFGVSIPKDLLRRFDHLIAQKGYANRSESLRDLIRNHLVAEEWGVGVRQVVGTITLVYSHNTRELEKVLTKMQHDWCRHILSTLHIHLDKHNCLEVLVVKGKSREIKSIADRLIAVRGVKHGELSMTTLGKDLA
jgi:CopG family nickel-responsive transcriptional regulator